MQVNKARKPHKRRFGKYKYYDYYGTVNTEGKRKSVRQELKKEGYSVRTLRWVGRGNITKNIDVYRKKLPKNKR